MVQSPTFVPVPNRYILPNGQHLDTLIQQGGQPPFQLLQFVQDTSDTTSWTDSEWEKFQKKKREREKTSMGIFLDTPWVGRSISLSMCMNMYAYMLDTTSTKQDVFCRHLVIEML